MANYYISTSGNDTTGDGSAGNPWQTISKFNTACASGDTCYVVTSASTYAFPDLTSISKSWTIRSVSGSPADVLIDGAAGTNRWRNSGTISTTAIGVTFKNLSPGGNSIFMAAANNWTLSFTDCIFRDLTLTGAGYSAGGIASCFTSTGCTFTFTSCVFYNNTGNTASGLNPLLATHQTSVTLNCYNCVFYLTNTGTSQFTYLSITNAGTLTSTVKNCIIYNSGSSLYRFAGNLTFDYNDSYGTFSDSLSGTGNITSDPLFVNAAGYDFRLRPTSPCLDAGVIL